MSTPIALDLASPAAEAGVVPSPPPEGLRAALLRELASAGLRCLVAGRGGSTAGADAVEIVIAEGDHRALTHRLLAFAEPRRAGIVASGPSAPFGWSWTLAWIEPDGRLEWLRIGLGRSTGLRPERGPAGRLRRWWQPAGAMVVVLGPDGTGKSTVLEGLAAAWRPVLGRVDRHHLRPGPPRAAPHHAAAAAPHGRPPRGPLPSLLKLAWLAQAHWLGHLRHVRPALAAGALVLFDRYAHDLLIDPLRFRHGGSPAAVRLLLRHLPRPDLVLLLDAPPEAILQRKQELPETELARQRAAYRALLAGRPGVALVDVDRPITAVMAEIHGHLLSLLHRRHRARLLDDAA